MPVSNQEAHYLVKKNLFCPNPWWS